MPFLLRLPERAQYSHQSILLRKWNTYVFVLLFFSCECLKHCNVHMRHIFEEVIQRFFCFSSFLATAQQFTQCMQLRQILEEGIHTTLFFWFCYFLATAPQHTHTQTRTLYVISTYFQRDDVTHTCFSNVSTFLRLSDSAWLSLCSADTWCNMWVIKCKRVWTCARNVYKHVLQRLNVYENVSQMCYNVQTCTNMCHKCSQRPNVYTHVSQVFTASKRVRKCVASVYNVQTCTNMCHKCLQRPNVYKHVKIRMFILHVPIMFESFASLFPGMSAHTHIYIHTYIHTYIQTIHM